MLGLWLVLVGCSEPTPEEHHGLAMAAVAAGDQAAAVEHALAGCAGEQREACWLVLELEGVPATERTAVAVALCESGEAAGCLSRAREADGEPWLGRACEAGSAEGCLLAAKSAGPADRPRWLAQACHLGDVVACSQAAQLALDAGDWVKAGALYGKRCEVEPEHASCVLGRQVLALGTQVRECSKGEAESCRSLCSSRRDIVDCLDPDVGLVDACGKRDARACTVIAEAKIHAGAPADEVNVWLWKGCDRVDPWACLRLADRLEAGEGAKPAAARGGVDWLRNQGCDLQLDYACAPHPL